MHFQTHSPALHDGHIHALRAAIEGTLAGLLAAVLVVIAYALSDLLMGDPFRTPAVLSSLVFEGESGAGIHGILLFGALHVSLWVVAGVGSACAIAVADAHPRVFRLVLVVLSLAWIGVLYLSVVLSLEAPEGTRSLHLWIGAFLGAAAVVGTLLSLHPRLLTQPERDLLTDASRTHLQQAFLFESQDLAAAEEAQRCFPAPVLVDLVARKLEALVGIVAALDRLEVEEPALDGEQLPVEPITLELALRRAVVRERDAIKHYDAFLASTDEPALRELFLRRRFEVADKSLPSLEAALLKLAFRG